MRACRYNFFYAIPIQYLDVHHGLHLEKKFIPCALRRITVAAFFRAEYGKLNSAMMEDLGHSPRDLLRALVKASRTANPKKNLRGFIPGKVISTCFYFEVHFISQFRLTLIRNIFFLSTAAASINVLSSI